MLLKPGLGAQYSGSIGGTTYSHNRGGVYARIRATPVNTPTAQRNAIRDIFGQLSSAWVNELTAGNRSSWDSYAAATTITNRIGAQITIGGNAMFIRSNTPRIQAGLIRIDDAPTTHDLGNFSPPAVNTATPPTGLTVDFNNADSWNLDDGGLLIYGSRPQNLTIQKFHGSYQLAGVAVGNTLLPAASPLTIVYPFTFATGQRLFLRATASQPDGRYSSDSFFQVDV